MEKIFRENNFDLIRLVAALQVAFFHIISHLKVDNNFPVIQEVLKLFPGVPIFFFISGFLISKSYEHNSNLPQYTKNRVLRIYPALITCTLVSIISVYLSGYFSNLEIDTNKILISELLT